MEIAGRSIRKTAEHLFAARSFVRGYSQHHDVYLWVGHFSSSFDGGPWLSAEILRALGDFGVAVRFGTYFSNEDRS